jgi:hypothetical protein
VQWFKLFVRKPGGNGSAAARQWGRKTGFESLPVNITILNKKG